METYETKVYKLPTLVELKPLWWLACVVQQFNRTRVCLMLEFAEIGFFTVYASATVQGVIH